MTDCLLLTRVCSHHGGPPLAFEDSIRAENIAEDGRSSLAIESAEDVITYNKRCKRIHCSGQSLIHRLLAKDLSILRATCSCNLQCVASGHR